MLSFALAWRRLQLRGDEVRRGLTSAARRTAAKSFGGSRTVIRWRREHGRCDPTPPYFIAVASISTMMSG